MSPENNILRDFEAGRSSIAATASRLKMPFEEVEAIVGRLAGDGILKAIPITEKFTTYEINKQFPKH
jgi:DNA-binding Lrp family transcriptional regulator